MTIYIYCLHVIIPESDRDAGNAMAEAASPDYDGSFTDANVSEGGVFPPTHIYVSARITEPERQAFAAKLTDWETYGLSAQPQFWLIRVEDGELLNSNTSSAQIGTTWGVAEQPTFAAANLWWTAFPEE